MILTVFLTFGCQTVRIERYDFPPYPRRPQIAPLNNSATVADVYNVTRDLMIYAEQWEAWGNAVQDLSGK